MAQIALKIWGLTPFLIAACSLPPQHRYAYECPDGYAFTITYSGTKDPGDVAILDDGSARTKLPRAPAASGARYSNGITAYWSKGDEATILVGGDPVHTGCSTNLQRSTDT